MFVSVCARANYADIIVPNVICNNDIFTISKYRIEAEIIYSVYDYYYY